MYIPKRETPPPATLDTHKPLPSIREGDWICLNCSNLNFSFRTVCNRCKMQTKETNFYNFIISTPEAPMFEAISQNNNFEQKQNNHQELEKQNTQNRPFQSVILLTPTKNYKNTQDGQPYKSPYCIPSVSPLLKKFNSSINGKYTAATNFSTSSPFRQNQVNVSEFNIEDDRIAEAFDFQVQSQISKLLFEIDLL